MILQHINDIAAICAAHGITDAILSPGSRSAALTLAFEAHPDINTHVITDERSAGFIGMGLAQQQKRPVVLICTSGSAGLNYSPAIAEAYYQEIPLIVLTADRPLEWIDQYDGQTINQTGMYGKHVKTSFDLPVDAIHNDAKWHSNRIVNEAILKAVENASGPVHINIPIREPFYPEKGEKISFSDDLRVIKRSATHLALSTEAINILSKVWNEATSRWIIVGQHEPDEKLTASLNELKDSATIINEITGNQHQVIDSIQNQDALFTKERLNGLSSPELLITIGNSLISKNLKIFLRKNPASTHWHIKETGRLNDSLQSLNEVIKMKASSFFEQLLPKINLNADSRELKVLNTEFQVKKASFFSSTQFGEFKAVEVTMKSIPANSNLHLANSMSVRYANFVGDLKDGVHVYCNRGTSGIDGSSSTAIGATMSSNKLNVLITGDLALFYDRNAFWNNEDYSNLRVVVLNNNGGGIFNMIPGPKAQNNTEKLFLTPHGLNAKSLAEDFNMDYQSAKTQDEFETSIKGFYAESDKPRILEVFSEIQLNTDILDQFKSL